MGPGLELEPETIYNQGMDIRDKMGSIAALLLKYQYHYYVLAEPLVPDSEYDRLFDELAALEKQYPELAAENSPTKRVGSDLDNTFPEMEHTVSVLSLDKEYTGEGIRKWAEKTVANTHAGAAFAVEEKLDGASIVLYYKQGLLETALTRGDGIRGNVVTDNVRTIGQVPLVLPEKIDIAVRGEIFIKKSEFEVFNRKFENKYSNPRNLAAGSLRNRRSSVVAEVPLNMFTYEGYYDGGEGHMEILCRLKALNFPVNSQMGLFSGDHRFLESMKEKLPDMVTGPVEQLVNYIEERAREREALDHEIDGLVVKVNDIADRRKMGETSHHPRWAVAFKFDSPAAETVLEDVMVQVGRNGRVSPVAILQPVQIAGSVVSRATLHNQEYIDILELGIGDRVSISKRGDIIPAVGKVIEKAEKDPSIYKIRRDCPFCGTPFVKDGAHHFCKNRECPERVKRSIVFFAGKGQMDIDTLGEKTIGFLLEKGFIKSIPDLYTFDYHRLLGEEGFKEKKIENIRQSIEESKKNTFTTLLTSLGIEGIGKVAAADLVKSGFDSFEKVREAAAAGDPGVFAEIEGFGEITAQFLIRHFTDPDNLKLIDELAAAGLKTAAGPKDEAEEAQIFEGETWVITGSFENYNPRELAAKEIEKRGGKVTSAVSAKTDRLLAGTGAGSKLARAEKLGIDILTEEEFFELIK